MKDTIFFTCKDCDYYCPRFDESSVEWGFCVFHWGIVGRYDFLCSAAEIAVNDSDLPTLEEWEAIGKNGCLK